MATMPFRKYRPFPPVALPARGWPERVLERAPRWCSVDLRDGNQALAEPMGSERKRRLFDELVRIGFKEIEVGFPSASQTDYEFVRELIEQGRVPDDVAIGVLFPAREELIARSFEALRGARRAIVHLYNSTSPQQRHWVFGLDRRGTIELAVHGARCVREQAERLRGTDVVYEYSPESFTATELDFALEICEAVMDVWEPTPERKVLLNLPATVELATPNVYADQIEWFAGRVSRRDALVLSVHPHNDRGTAVAAAELALLAGAERVEGTLFGNGERTGNVDLCTLALNLLTQGVDPQLDLSDIERVVRTAEHCNRLPVHPRHPYAGELVFTAFSGSHQDAIRKALTARRVGGAEVWDVPYLPIDPADLGRSYTPVIRVNSQSGKAGVAYLLERDQGLALPRVLQIEFARRVQAIADASGEELGSEALWRMFRGEYVDLPGPVRLVDYRVVRDAGQGCDLAARLEIAGAPHRLHGCGSGPIAAFLDGLRGLGVEARVADYAEHALGAGNDAAAVCYVQLEGLGDEPLHGVGIDPDITTASLRALISAVNRAHRCGAWSVPAPRLAAGGIVSAFAAVPEEERCV